MDNKQLKKVLSKMKMKGEYKQVFTFKECDILLILNHNNPRENAFYRKESFEEEILSNIPEGFSVIYLKNSNPHDSKQIAKSFMHFKFNKNKIW